MIEAELHDGTVLEFPDDTDPAVIQQTVKKMLNAEDMPIGRPRDILGQPLKAIGSSLAGKFAGGAAGGARSLVSGLPAGLETQQGIEQAVSGSRFGRPTTRIGQIGQEMIGGAMETVGDYAEEIPAYIAQKGEEYIGDPEIAEQTAQQVRERGFLPTVSNRLLDMGVINPYGYAAINMAPEIAAAATGGGLAARNFMRGRGQIARELKGDRPQPGTDLVPMQGQDMGAWKGVPVRPEIPKTGMTDAELAQYKLVGGKAVKDEAYKPLVRKGIEPTVLTEYKTATNTTKDAQIKMTEIKRRGMLYREYGKDNRPADVVGQELVPQINHVKTINRKSGKMVAEEANKLKGKTVDFTKPFDEFVDEVETLDIPLRQALQTPEFWQGSRADVIKRIKGLYEGSDLEAMPGFQRPLTNVLYRAGTGKGADAYDLHKMKKFIDANVTYGKGDTGVLARVGGILKNLRSDIDEVLDNNFDGYRKANETYSETIRALDDLQDVLPKRIQLDIRNYDKALGQELRRLESNYNVRIPLGNAVDQITQTSAKYGRPYDGNLSTLVTYMTDLDRIFGNAPKTSLPGIMEDFAKDIKQGKSPKQKVVERFTQRLAPEDEEAFELLKDILTSR